MGIAAIEALACGVPLIVADNRGTREYLHNDKNGLICDAFDRNAFVAVSDERKESVDFTDSYATGVQAIIVKEGSKIKTNKDLLKKGANVKVGVQLGTTGDIYCTDDLKEAGSGTVEEYNKGADAVQALVTGKIDCVVIDNEPAKAFVKANKGLKLLKTAYAEEDYAIAVSKDKPDLRKKINKALKELIDDGSVQKIINKYIKAE